MGVYAQSGNISLQWNEQKAMVGENSSYTIPAIQNYHYNYRTDLGIIEASIMLDESRRIDAKSFTILNVKTQRLAKKYADISMHSIPSDVQFSLSYGSSDTGSNNLLTFVPFVKKGNEIHQIVSFEYQYKIDNQNRNATFSLNTSSSVLANGSWFKIKVNQTGIYKLDRTFLTQLGVPTSVDPRTIKVYGHGGQMLPLLNSENLYFDNPEVAVYANGENDGSLDENDYFLFYGIGTQKWNAFHASHNNLYSDDSYYYITYGGGTGKRVSSLQQPSQSATIQISDSEERVFHELDLINIGNLSRKWFGESFSTSFTNTYSLNLINPVTTKSAKFSGNFAASSSAKTFMDLSLNSQLMGTIEINAKGRDNLGNEFYFEYLYDQPQVANQITVQFNNNGVPAGKGYVDFVAIDYFKELKGYGKQFSFRNSVINNTPEVANFTLSNASSISQVWEVTDGINPAVYQHNQTNQLSLKVQGGQAREFVALDLNDLYTPTAIGSVVNQNLKGTIFNDGPIDYLLITHQDLLPAANRLAQFHRSKNNYNVKVVTVSTIYEEFSSGKQDIAAIRNFVRYVYHNSPNPERKLKFLNIFGDTSFDYKNRIENNTNVVPIFHSLNNTLSSTNLGTNFNDQTSFSTDDFYVLLDENEGLIVNQSYLGLDVAVGRMLADNLTEANVLVDKVVSYHDIENSGRWKLNGIALADDVDIDGDRTLQEQLNTTMDNLVEAKSIFNIRKIFMDAYQQEVSAGGPRYPKAKQDFYQAVESGALFVNFLGHGGDNGLTGERMMDVGDIEALNNASRLPLFIILTCEFTRYDNPNFLSGGERLLKKSQGGAIALLATSRKILITNANVFTHRINERLFNTNGATGDDVSIAEVLRLTKNTGPGEKAVVHFFGDPALKLAIPKPEVVLTKVNGIDAASFEGSLRALDLVKIEGKVQDQNGTFLSNFNGDLAVQIYDKSIQRQTLGNDGVFYNGQLYKMNFETLGETVFKGNAKVENGVFQIEFVVPKDIKMAIGEGKISFYASKDGQIIDDYSGANTSIKVGGLNNNAAEDNKSPIIKLYMNDESFIYGGMTNSSPLFLAQMEDENGINTASGIGHDMIAILDGDENNPIVLNEFYETEPNNFRKGFVKYPYKDLAPGVHTIVFKAWDSYNNMGTAEIQFVVSDQKGVVLNNVLNYPNPFIDYTEFWFEHNRPQEPLQVQVQILSVAGRIVKTINQTIVNDGFNSRDLHWDGKDDFGNKVGKGVYIYKLKVKSTLTGEQVEKIEKLVIL